MKPAPTSLRFSVWVVIAISLFAITSCGGTPRRVGPDPVPVGEWCHTVGRTLCNWTMDSCMGGEAEWVDGTYSCEDRYSQACTAGRNRFVSSGYSYDQLAACVDLVERTSCAEIGATSTTADGRGGFDYSRLPADIRSACQLAR